MNDEQMELVSAYLDGAVTDAERARVEADPELLAAVEELHAVRQALAETEPATAEGRESTIAAGLAAFDRLSTGGDGADPDDDGSDADAVVLAPPARHRWRWAPFAGAAAAAAVIVIGGIAIFRDPAEAPTAVEAPEVDDDQLADDAPAEPEQEDDAIARRSPDDDDDEEEALDEFDEEPKDAPAVAPAPAPDPGPEDASEADEAEPAVAPALAAEEEAGAEDGAAPLPTAVAGLPRVESSVDLLDVAAELADVPPTLGELRLDCAPDGGVDREPDLVISPDAADINDDVHAVVVVIPSPSGDRYGAVSIETCALLLVSPSV